MIEQLALTAAVSMGGGILSGVVVVATMRADVRWIKKALDDMGSATLRAHERIDNLAVAVAAKHHHPTPHIRPKGANHGDQ